jgi:hypothetical protein
MLFIPLMAIKILIGRVLKVLASIFNHSLNL